jgi:hypothetical protein
MHRRNDLKNIGKSLAILSLLGTLLLLGVAQAAPPLPGAIFTTTVDGSIVNENVRYEAKEDVYLDGGPGPNAPPNAAGLPEGNYYFQVTDPSGKHLLSTDHISCRRIHVNEYGVIDFVFPGTNYVWVNGNGGKNGNGNGWVAEACQHPWGIDVDHSALGAITVQLVPYDDTPNRGGVYKVWVTRIEDYAAVPFDPNTAGKRDPVNGEDYGPGYFHGFIPAMSKTDNYKVKRRGPPCDDPQLAVRKFHDENLNGDQDAGEEDITGWAVDITDPLDVTNTHFTPVTILTAQKGNYTAVEDTPDGTLQTVSLLDDVVVSIYPAADPTVSVEVRARCGETHEIVYGDVGLGEIEACKIYDRDGNGEPDDGEPDVAGWRMELTGTDVTGANVGPIVQETGEDGCTTFSGLLPGTYVVTELMPTTDGWFATGPISETFTLQSSWDGEVLSAGFFDHDFTNYCLGEGDFGTKGYWHNKNGLDELTEDDRDYVNGLDPYSEPSSYFDAGDEPFDGEFEDGTPVAAVHGEWGEEVAPEGSWKAEVSHFLVDSNAGGDPREQLAQQLLAFIFNVRHRLDDPGALIELPDGTWASAESLIDEAIAAWLSGDAGWQNDMADLLDELNNNDAVPFIHFFPCDVIYE